MKFIMSAVIINMCIWQNVIGDPKSSQSGKRNRRYLTFPPTAPTRIQFIGGIGIPVEDLHYESVTSGYVLKAEYFLPTIPDDFRPAKLKPQTIHRRSANEYSSNDITYSKTNSTINVPYSKDNSVDYNSYDEVQNNDRIQNSNNKFKKNKSHKHSTNSADNVKSQQRPAPREAASVYRWILYKSVETVLNRSGLPGHICMLRSICEHASIPLQHDGGLLGEILHIILTPSTSLDDMRESSNFHYLDAEHLGRHRGHACADIYKECIKSPLDLITAVFDVD